MDEKFLESNSFFRSYYEDLKKVFDDVKKHGTPIPYIRSKMFNIYPKIRRNAESEERKAFLKECEQEIVACYQISLDRNYEKIRAQKEQGVMNSSAIETWVLTIDEQGIPKKTTVIGVDENGNPIYADNCTAIEITHEYRYMLEDRHELHNWISSNENLYEMRAAAQELKKKGRLGMESIPEPNYNLDGMVGGQLDAAAWENYTIANGMYRPTDYDKSLDHLLKMLDKCIDFYEKAISMV